MPALFGDHPGAVLLGDEQLAVKGVGAEALGGPAERPAGLVQRHFALLPEFVASR
jgi:hypothetical protein